MWAKRVLGINLQPITKKLLRCLHVFHIHTHSSYLPKVAWIKSNWSRVQLSQQRHGQSTTRPHLGFIHNYLHPCISVWRSKVLWCHDQIVQQPVLLAGFPPTSHYLKTAITAFICRPRKCTNIIYCKETT